VQTDLLLIPMGADYAALRRAALAAEAAGFAGIWTWDHLRATGGEGPTPEAWTVLTALAEAVPRVSLGPLVLNVINRHPGVLANMAATLQQVSGGRLILGLGAGGSRSTPYAAEQAAIGQPVEPDGTRRARVVEAIQVMKGLWAGEGGNFEGRHYALRRPSGFLRPDPPPPIVVGAFGPRMADVAGRYGDGLNTQAAHPQLGRMVEVARAARAESGRDPAGLLVTVFAGLGERWLRPGSGARQTLEGLGVSRLILLVEPPFEDRAIRTAGEMLDGRSP
jgi:alkanesulfonate monooxygenase SsuD/methylene tetrahydromethanopterin reductase-like flavin-dependent oxidoreductase (luciferase family)